MKALTLWQPWATLVAIGKKQIETRNWTSRYRGPLAIHSAKRPVYKTLDMDPTCFTDCDEVPISDWPLGCVIAIAELVDVKKITVESRAKISITEIHLGNYDTEFESRYMWVIRDPKQITPVPARGYQSLWNWDERMEL